MYIILEFCSGGDLAKFLSKQPKRRISEHLAKSFMLQLGNVELSLPGLS